MKHVKLFIIILLSFSTQISGAELWITNKTTEPFTFSLAGIKETILISPGKKNGFNRAFWGAIEKISIGIENRHQHLLENVFVPFFDRWKWELNNKTNFEQLTNKKIKPDLGDKLIILSNKEGKVFALWSYDPAKDEWSFLHDFTKHIISD